MANQVFHGFICLNQYTLQFPFVTSNVFKEDMGFTSKNLRQVFEDNLLIIFLFVNKTKRCDPSNDGSQHVFGRNMENYP